MRALLIVAGLGQLALAIASLAIPRLLRWREETARLGPLTREVFWTYSGYIWTTNLCFGLLSVLAPEWLLDGTPLARAVCIYIAAYWGARLVIQFIFFGKHAPPGKIYRLAGAALVILFLYLTVLYTAVAVTGD